ncbi:RNA polymerase factor sigma-70 [Paraburkholderia bonniea]|uniref:RNA polymerase factor sigma-70 n=1 Tax=Paraburkholderia bonniea TaxID=2152891 RepID=UPI0012910502|nr:RNA polymerase factor sigma-70 [Paraburkholderia bonniea]WJF91880.1 RNA polymerase factor sigma-70 [Paraburkholderia bonniea]WJF95199.1 RNA polymerase factor sigma-70 [Paraburkholderia bonniea]
MAEVFAQAAPSLTRQPRPCLPSPASGKASVRCGAQYGLLAEVLIAQRHMLVNLARSFVGCGSRAEDVVHDVFIKLSGFPNQDAIRQPQAYVTRMVRNAAIDACRRQALENTWHACEEDGFEVPSPEPTPETALVTRDALRQAFDALAQLPERTRTAFELVRLSEETLQETARQLKVSQTLVHFMVRDAAQHCANCAAGSFSHNACASRPRSRGKKTQASNVN